MKIKIKRFIQKKLKSTEWIFSVCFFIAILITILWTPPKEQNLTKTNPPAIDTLIPKGFVLVPIEVANQENLKSVIDSYGLVSLYQKEKRIISHVKLIRAPKNPEQFAVLVSEGLSSEILKYQEPFKIVIQNPSEKGEEIFKKKKKKRVILEVKT